MSRMARNWSSVRLRGWSQTARELEWEATNGRVATPSRSAKPWSFRCDTSTAMRCSSSERTTSRPKEERPSVVTLPLAMLFLPFHVSVTIFTPSRANSSMTPRSWPMGEPFSTVSMPVRWPGARLASIWLASVTRVTLWGSLWTSARNQPATLRYHWCAVMPCRSSGTQMARHWHQAMPARRSAESWRPLWPSVPPLATPRSA